MKQTVNESDFIDAFIGWHGGQYKNNFSYEGKIALFEHLEECEESCDREIELDVVAICCDYSEYEDCEDFLTQYFGSVEEGLKSLDLEIEEDETEEDFKDRVREKVVQYLEHNTALIWLGSDLDNGFIIENF